MFSNSDANFNARKAGQVAAFFLLQARGLLNVVKIIKLIYLADREFMRAYDEPMLMDCLVSMKNGPVNSATYACVNEGRDGWDDFISDRAVHNVGLVKSETNLDDLDELSEADTEVLAAIWAQFGHMNQWQLVAYTHKNCPEWEDPGNTSTEIPYLRVFKFLGKDDPERLAKNITDYKYVEEIIAGV